LTNRSVERSSVSIPAPTARKRSPGGTWALLRYSRAARMISVHALPVEYVNAIDFA